MTDMILILAFCISIVAFVEIVRRREQNSDSTRRTVQPAAPAENADHQTRVKELLDRHAADDCLTVNLTAGAHSKLGKIELCNLRSGAPLWLEHCDYSGIERVKVYSGGFMVGELLLTDAERVIDLMQNSRIHGTYVAENNSKPGGNVDMRIVIFHEAAAVDSATASATEQAMDRAMASPYKITVDVLDRPSIFQN